MTNPRAYKIIKEQPWMEERHYHLRSGPARSETTSDNSPISIEMEAEQSGVTQINAPKRRLLTGNEVIEYNDADLFPKNLFCHMGHAFEDIRYQNPIRFKLRDVYMIPGHLYSAAVSSIIAKEYPTDPIGIAKWYAINAIFPSIKASAQDPGFMGGSDLFTSLSVLASLELINPIKEKIERGDDFGNHALVAKKQSLKDRIVNAVGALNDTIGDAFDALNPDAGDTYLGTDLLEQLMSGRIVSQIFLTWEDQNTRPDYVSNYRNPYISMTPLEVELIRYLTYLSAVAALATYTGTNLPVVVIPPGKTKKRDNETATVRSLLIGNVGYIELGDIKSFVHSNPTSLAGKAYLSIESEIVRIFESYRGNIPATARIQFGRGITW